MPGVLTRRLLLSKLKKEGTAFHKKGPGDYSCKKKRHGEHPLGTSLLRARPTEASLAYDQEPLGDLL